MTRVKQLRSNILTLVQTSIFFYQLLYSYINCITPILYRYSIDKLAKFNKKVINDETTRVKQSH